VLHAVPDTTHERCSLVTGEVEAAGVANVAKKRLERFAIDLSADVHPVVGQAPTLLVRFSPVTTLDRSLNAAVTGSRPW